MTAPITPERVKDAELEQFVAQQVRILQQGYLDNKAAPVAALAKLRRAVTATGTRAETWAYVLADLPDSLADPADRFGEHREGLPTAWERAAHDAIVLFAWHQQAKKTERMHRSGAGFGAAIRQLGEKASSAEAILTRFHALNAATQHQARLVHLRSLIGQLRTHSIPLDYGRLARDLRRLQGPHPDWVQLSWARDYHHKPATNQPATDQAITDEAAGSDTLLDTTGEDQ
ncbi:type I-E CRISPR-associated protein Cse2/CasB [Nocardia sp. NPDC050435]|uniref:type I-E CRISPR-associated protein Cse2/CasB n=1 Tax=Nocardia sp. NPDC050435 TaxID=3155040 RepID=UPI0033DA6A2D